MASIEDIPELLTRWLRYCLFFFCFIANSIYASSSSPTTSSSGLLTQNPKASPARTIDTHHNSSSTSINARIGNALTKASSQSSAEDLAAKSSITDHLLSVATEPASGNTSKPQKTTPENSTNTSTYIPLRYLWVTWIIQVCGIFLTVGTFGWAIYTFRTQSRKSIYDDFWFREIFFKKLSSELIEFRKKWNREKCRHLKLESSKRQLTKDIKRNVKFRIDVNNNLTKEFLADLAILRDLANSIEALAPEAMEEFEEIFDTLESISTSDNPEGIHSQVISRVYKHAFSIHEKMRSTNYESLTTLNG